MCNVFLPYFIGEAEQLNQQKKSGEGSVLSPLFLRLSIPTWEAV